MDPISMAAESFSVHGPGGVRIVADRLGDPRARAVVFLHGGGQTRRSWGRAAAAVAERGWQAVTIDLRGHGESDWSSEGDYRLVSFAGDIQEVLRNLPGQPALVGASLGGFAAMLLAGELSPGIASAVVLVDIVPNMDLAGASRIHAFMAERVESGFGSLDEVADVIANYNPHRPRPSDPDGLVANLRRRGDRWYWHWDPQFIGGIAAFPPVEVTDVDRMNAAVATILRDEVPVLLVRRPSQRHRPPRKRRPISLAVSASRVHRCARRRTYGRRRSQRRFRRGGPRFSRSACRRPMMGLGKVLHSQPASACVRTPTSALACRPYVSLIWVPSRRAAARR